MIPPNPAPVSDEDRTKLADRVYAAHRDYAQPPAPVRGLERADVILTGRTTWAQTVPDQLEDATTRFGEIPTEAEVYQNIANQAVAVANPVRELALALTRFADQLDRQGVVPLGIHVCTEHLQPATMMYWDYAQVPRVAHVVTTVRGVRREWIEQHRTAADPVSAQLDPQKCACYTWTIADARNADWWGRQHHPRCDGTGQHKTEETPQP